ncbi:hypothetical protein [uncultured Amnibacterium sp.]|uniref:hypothetical protein n=1 Tax=uncultured Amnibacterium sp. TaxID=1631851 RepID=UPI0035CB74C9
MTAAAVALLLGVAGLVGVAIALPVLLLRARRIANDRLRLPASALVPPLVLGVVLVASVAAIVGVVVLQ